MTVYTWVISNTQTKGTKMAVRAKRVVKGVGRGNCAVCAADLLKDDHPLHKVFVAWVGNKSITKRQAREFLKSHPQYREIRNVEG